MGGGADFNRLIQEKCVVHILAFTSPRDVCRLSAVCRYFRAAAESEIPWERFLPSDWWQLIPRSVSALHFTSKRDLFFRLSKPILIDDGTKAFWLDKASGKKCFLLSSKLLQISYRAKKMDWCKWTAAEASVFPEVLEWVEGLEVDLRGTVNLTDLSPNTMYVVRFIVGLPSQKQVWKGRLDLSLQLKGQDKQEQTVSINPNQEGNGLQPSTEFDGWKQVEVGEFYSSNGDGGKVGFRMFQMETLELKFNKNGTVEFVEVAPSKWRISFSPDEEMKVAMGGLLVMGVEIRPSNTGLKFDPNSGELLQSFGESARISEVSASDSVQSDGSTSLFPCFGGRKPL